MIKSRSDFLSLFADRPVSGDPINKKAISNNSPVALYLALAFDLINRNIFRRSCRLGFLGLLILFFLPFIAVGQNRMLDSLRNKLKAAKTDQDKIADLLDVVGYYYDENRDSALYYIDEALPVAKKTDMLMYAYTLDGKAYELMHLGKFPQSFICLQEALEIAANPQSEKNTLFYLRIKGWTAKTARLDVLAGIHQHLGHLSGRAGNFKEQIDQYKQAQYFFQRAGTIWRLGNLNMNLGAAYISLNRLDSAMLFERKAETIFKQNGGSSYLTNVYLNISTIFSKRGEKAAELTYIRKALDNPSKRNIYSRLANSYSYLADYYTRTHQPDSTLFYANKALVALQTAHSKNFNTVNNLFYKAYRLKGNIDSAYKYQGLVLAFNDSTYKSTIKNLSEVQQLSFKDQLRLRDIEKQTELDKTRNRTYILLAVVGVFGLLSLIFYRNYRQKQIANQLLNQQKQEIESQRDDLTLALAELKTAQTQLIQSEKMASLGELTAGIAHEIQNPLNFVNNFSEVNTELINEMQQEIEKGNYEEVKAIASDINDNQQKISQHGKRADFIVKGMLQHSRISTGERQLTDINTLVDEFLKLSYHGLRAKDKSFNAKLVNNFDEALPKINIVQQDMGRVLLNLFNNAFYAVNERKNIDGDNYEPVVEVTTAITDNQLSIKVKDNGMGIPDAVKEKIMQPFFTTKPAGEGTGLGLSLSYDIVVKGHGGNLTVESEKGNGSTFTVQLPRTVL